MHTHMLVYVSYICMLVCCLYREEEHVHISQRMTVCVYMYAIGSTISELSAEKVRLG